MITAEKLTFGFSSTPLFQNISFHLEENRHCALIGSNGTGKTTRMNLIREPENYVFDGKLQLDGAGRMGYVGQFSVREGDQQVTVFDYLSEDFLRLQGDIADVCAQMETAEDLDTLMDRYQALLEESDAIDADNCELNIRRQLLQNHLVEAIIILPRNMFYSTDISVTLWILAGNRKARTVEQNGKMVKYRYRENEVLFVDLRQWGEPFE